MDEAAPEAEGDPHCTSQRQIQDWKALDWVMSAKSVLPSDAWWDNCSSLAAALLFFGFSSCKSDRSEAVSQELGSNLSCKLKFWGGILS